MTPNPELQARDEAIVARYLPLPPMPLTRAAALLGVKKSYLEGALTRTGTSKNVVRRVERVVVRDHSARQGWEPYPPGHPVTWGALLALTPSIGGVSHD